MDLTISAELLSKVQGLGDLELVVLLCLVSRNHAIVQTEENALPKLEKEFIKTAQYTFGLTSTSIRCDQDTTLEKFASSLLVEKTSMLDSLDYSGNEGMCIPNVIVLRDVQKASREVQIQTLELMRTRRIFTHTSVQTAPKHFMLVLTSATGSPPLLNHLREHVFLSHIHDPHDGFPHLTNDVGSEEEGTPLLSLEEIDLLLTASMHVTCTVEVTRYLNDIVVFLRMHRAVAAGTTPLATKHLMRMSECLAVLHGLAYVTPSLVALGVGKIYRHRLVLVDPVNERSLQYGSDLKAVSSLLKDTTVDSVIDEVVESVECPL